MLTIIDHCSPEWREHYTNRVFKSLKANSDSIRHYDIVWLLTRISDYNRPDVKILVYNYHNIPDNLTIKEAIAYYQLLID